MTFVLNESTVKVAALEWLRTLGYAAGCGPHLVRGEPAAERVPDEQQHKEQQEHDDDDAEHDNDDNDKGHGGVDAGANADKDTDYHHARLTTPGAPDATKAQI